MKKITKICAVVAACLAAIGMTGCNFGKDDFYGYWRTTDFDANGNRIDYYQVGSSYYQIDWDFNGVSEDMFKDGGTFKQHLKRATSVENLRAGTYDNETFWTGKYQLKGNSDPSKGSLILFYEYGVQLETYGGYEKISGYTYNDVKDFSEADFLNIWKHNTKSPTSGTTGLGILADSSLQTGFTNNSDGSSGRFRNGIYVQTRYITGQTKKEYGDIEYFRYRLEDAAGFKGYARMLTTTVDKNGTHSIGGVYNQWHNDGKTATGFDPKLGSESSKYGWKNNSECSWNTTNFRALGLREKNGDWASNDSRTNAELFKITVTGGKITGINATGDNDDTDYSDIDR